MDTKKFKVIKDKWITRDTPEITEKRFKTFDGATNWLTQQIKYHKALGWIVYWSGFHPVKVLLARKCGEELSFTIEQED